jgi:F0F1-type ATP synthase gamma subunit
MQTQNELKQEFDQLDILQSITGVYGQLASIWMSSARDNIIRSRDYLFEMHQVFLTVFSSYAQEVQRLAKKKNLRRNGKITFLAHNGKKVGVFLGANMGFYGDIVNKTFELFIEEVRKDGLEVTVVGRQGVVMLQNEEPNMPYTFFDIPDEHVDQHQLLELIRHLVQYEEIRIYYGRFESFVTQQPMVFKLSADPYAELTQEKNPKHYIFEPNIEKILVFFEKQVFSSIFEQTIRESQLAKAASRVMLMDRASENIKSQLKGLRQKELRLIHQKTNQKQQGRFSSMSLWARS